ncbi:hypothetical protein B0H14DRAFT_2588969 [Mycena olivaceomarginata]|nr:hypothetical protein B0H14DRAFT_2629329 [Mycena olivaceomarginata]KAJ7837878.1 hypothetical protein B0H14DRAFT_2588969 [Mycena olivaceomarginata]
MPRSARVKSKNLIGPSGERIATRGRWFRVRIPGTISDVRHFWFLRERRWTDGKPAIPHDIEDLLQCYMIVTLPGSSTLFDTAFIAHHANGRQTSTDRRHRMLKQDYLALKVKQECGWFRSCGTIVRLNLPPFSSEPLGLVESSAGMRNCGREGTRGGGNLHETLGSPTDYKTNNSLPGRSSPVHDGHGFKYDESTAQMEKVQAVQRAAAICNRMS